MTSLASSSSSNTAIETVCPYQDYISSRTSVGSNIRGRVLPPIQEEDSFVGSQFLENMDSILEGVSRVSDGEEWLTLTTGLEDYHLCHENPHLPHDSPTLMSANDRKQSVTEQRTPGTILRERMEAYLSSRTCQAHATSVYPELQAYDGSLETISTISNMTSKGKDPDIMTRKDKIIVWEIQPVDCEETFGRVLFSFTTEYGVCFLLKYKHAIEFVDIINKYSNKSTCDAFYQVYAVDGIESSIVRTDRISSLLQEMISKLQPPIPSEDGEELIHDNANVVKDPSTRGPIQRFHHYLNRRRFKKVIRCQIRIAVGRGKTSSRGRLFLTTFQFLWKRLPGK